MKVVNMRPLFWDYAPVVVGVWGVGVGVGGLEGWNQWFVIAKFNYDSIWLRVKV